MPRASETPEVRFVAHGPVLHEYVRSKAFMQVIRGPLGSGKTTASIFKMMQFMKNQFPDKGGVRRSRYLVTRATYPELVSTTIADWKSMFVPELFGSPVMGTPPRHELEFWLPDGTKVVSTVYFVALDRPSDIVKIKGINLTGAWMNEVKQQPKSIFDELTSRVDRWPFPGQNAWGGVIGDTNAWDNDHWLERMFQQWEVGEMSEMQFFVQPPGVLQQHGKWVPNPDAEIIPSLREKYYQRQLQGKDEQWIKVNLANQNGVSFDGQPVHPDYNDELHTAHEMLQPHTGVIHVGMDFGIQCAATFFQRQTDSQWWGLEEVTIDKNGDTVALADAIKVKCADLRSRCKGDLTFLFRGDPFGAHRVGTDSSTPFSVLRTAGIHGLPCTTNDPEMRRAALRRPLTRLVNGRPGVIFSPVMKSLRRALAGGFHYKRVALAGETDRFRDVPVKDLYSHVAESAEYALLDAGEHSVVNADTPVSRAFGRGPVTPAGADWNPYTA